eukprot:16139-Eustigmatos_ZCMA.PRE.1
MSLRGTKAAKSSVAGSSVLFDELGKLRFGLGAYQRPDLSAGLKQHYGRHTTYPLLGGNFRGV